RRERIALSAALAPYEVTSIMARYIITLHARPGVSQDFLAEFHAVDKSFVARVCGRLEELGYIDRRPNENDRRANCIFLTEKGGAIHSEIMAFLLSWGSSISDGVSEEDLRMTISTMERINRSIDALSGHPDRRGQPPKNPGITSSEAIPGALTDIHTR
ncbi:MAG: MarR family transcriptional regulator, partial [Clostridiales bacterium]|nr:MarR family transcriptional regulator [Clostridiales bacterium]